jgi:hypothetical protein
MSLAQVFLIQLHLDPTIELRWRNDSNTRWSVEKKDHSEHERTWDDHSPMDWQDMAVKLDLACQGTVDYVIDISDGMTDDILVYSTMLPTGTSTPLLTETPIRTSTVTVTHTVTDTPLFSPSPTVTPTVTNTVTFTNIPNITEVNYRENI